MKLLTTFLLLSFANLTLANPESHCSQATLKFENVLTKYDTCSARGANCQSFCDEATSLLHTNTQFGSGSAMQGCLSSELDNARRQGRDEVLRDLRAKHTLISSDFFGINEDDCRRRVLLNSQALIVEAQRECNRKAMSIKNCKVLGEPRITGSFGTPPRIEGKDEVKLRASSSTRVQCEQAAIEKASSKALANCQAVVGANCNLSSVAPIVRYDLDKNALRADRRICKATVYAEAPADITYRCKAEITAQNQATAE